ncbi:hypothetical protein PSTG_01215 [Puccinia striiformis f. sp. tritici PST-78]|uniref:Uncharacterized protein n=1 Tax=Puccinia striiformis f. sp. tritici PST-78 TaxID=1165861 RepID=A0A0L0W2Q1_9BASI|nr:hypothetical protein PSTG_01215 [Puccinia striiformis f. sp. tritici PST-78]
MSGTGPGDEYFKLAKWPKEWIDEAISLTREMYDAWYKPKKSTAVPKPRATGPPKPPTGVLAGLGAAAIARSAEAMSDPIDIWLFGGMVLEDGAPVNGLRWWVDQKRGGNTHHGLLQMALDVMCCPGQSMLSEHSILAETMSPLGDIALIQKQQNQTSCTARVHEKEEGPCKDKRKG